MGRLIRYLTSGRFLWMLGVAGCLGWTAGFVLYHAGAEKLVTYNGNVLGRDFTAFYVAGTMVRQGRGDQLYNHEAQLAAQAEVLGRYGERRQGFISYINPASVAVAYSALARMGYLTAFYLHTALMVGCFVGGMWLLRPHLPHLSSGWATAVMLGLLLFPMTQTITGGQNAALTFLLLAGAFAAAMRRRPGLSGLALGLLLFKPQYALPLLGLLLLKRQWATIGVACLLGMGHYLLGASFCGWDWPADMKAYLDGYYGAQELAVNGRTHISIVVALEYWLTEPLARTGAAPWATGGLKAAAYACVVAVVLHLMWRWRTAEPGRPGFGLHFAIVVAASLSISPHTQYYDAGLLILPVLLVIEEKLRRAVDVSTAERALLIAGHASSVTYLAAEWIHFQPLVLWPIAVFWWADRLICEQPAAAPVAVPVTESKAVFTVRA